MVVCVCVGLWLVGLGLDGTLAGFTMFATMVPRYSRHKSAVTDHMQRRRQRMMMSRMSRMKAMMISRMIHHHAHQPSSSPPSSVDASPLLAVVCQSHNTLQWCSLYDFLLVFNTVFWLKPGPNSNPFKYDATQRKQYTVLTILIVVYFTQILQVSTKYTA